MPANIKKAGKFGGQCKTTSPKMSKSTQVTNTLLLSISIRQIYLKDRHLVLVAKVSILERVDYLFPVIQLVNFFVYVALVIVVTLFIIIFTVM